MSNNQDFVNSMDKATLELIASVKAGMETYCLRVERDSKKNCPVNEGILRASIDHEVEADETEITGRVGSNLEIAPYVHQGTGIYAVDGNGRKTPWKWQGIGKYKGWHITRGQKPQPFLQDAVIKNKDKFSITLAEGGN